MKVKIAMVGELPDSKQIYSKIDMLIGQITAKMSKNSGEIDVQPIVSDCFSGENWLKWNTTHDFDIVSINNSECSFYPEKSRYTVSIETTNRSIVCNEMTNRSDIAIVVWNEKTSDLSGATWEFIKNAYDKKMPCVWISSAANAVYCLQDSYYEPYTPEYLEKHLIPLPVTELAASDSVNEPRGAALSFWIKRRKKFLARHKADNAVFESVDDVLLREEAVIGESDPVNEDIRKRLAEKFREFDTAAIELNSRYNAMLYQRSILPFIATIFLAVGFYAETLIGKTFSAVFPDAAQGIVTFAAVLAGVGFLIHGMLNLYTYRLHINKKIDSWHSDFVNNRFTAEVLRVLVHFLPYGIVPDLRALCISRNELFSYLMHGCDDELPAKTQTGQGNIRDVLQHVRELLLSQLSYHEASVGRYEKILNKLTKWNKAIMYIGFIVVILRGLLQFLLVFFPISAMNGVDLNSITRSFLNMLALILPAWAGYFATKAAINNIGYNYNNHKNMLERMRKMLQRVDFILEHDNISVDISNRIAEELVDILVNEDLADWTVRYNDSTIKPL